MLLPGCTTCCNCGCECGTLPYTLTVTFSGLLNRTHSTHCGLGFSSTFGSGAAGVGMSPGGYDPDDRGPLTQVLLTDGGCGYAIIGRAAPAVTITGSGDNAVFAPTLEEGTDGSGRPAWSLASVAVSGGTGYTDGESLRIVIDGVVLNHPNAVLANDRTIPSVAADVSGYTGTGAVLVASVSANAGSPATWGVSSVSVSAGGTGYTNGASVVFSVTGEDGVEVSSATGTINTGSGQPTVEESWFGTDSFAGAGATFTFSWNANGSQFDLVVALDGGGQGYAVGEAVSWSRSYSEFVLYAVTAVDGAGAITAISLVDSSPFDADINGQIVSVTVTDAGEYYVDTGIPDSVTVAASGSFFQEDETLPPVVADVTVTPCGGGTGAEITATIGQDPTNKATFGKITGLTVSDGGSDYLVWEWVCVSQSNANDVPFVLKAGSPKKLVTLAISSCYGSGACAVIDAVGLTHTCDGVTSPTEYEGGETPLRQVTLQNEGSGYAKLGREHAVLTFDGDGVDATFSATFASQQVDACGLPYWPIESVSVGGDGTEYTDGSTLTILPSTGNDKVYAAAVVKVHTREEPIVLATATGPGSGASLSVTLNSDDTIPKTWYVYSVDGGGGSGYLNGSAIVFSTPERDEVYGTYEVQGASAYAIVDESGAIVGVDLQSPGAYYRIEGVPQDCTVSRPGGYYRENAALDPYVAAVTVTVEQLPPSAGSGGAVTVVVEDDTGSVNFGKIVSASISSQGSGYTILGGPLFCTYGTDICTTVDGSLSALVTLRGHLKEPYVTLVDTRVVPSSSAVFKMTSPLGDCDSLPASANLLYGAPSGVTATITRGGSVPTPCADPAWCGPCECSLDGVEDLGSTPVAFSTDCPPCPSGTLSGSGTLDDITSECIADTGVEVPVSITVSCCDDDCNNDGPCINKIRVTFYAYIPTDFPDNPLLAYAVATGTVCTDAVAVVGGALAGTVSIPLTELDGRTDLVNCTATITFG